ncbi:MAG: type II toxin-antitoxin system VapC family toxin [Candidatus Dormibacteria bacterium]
MSGDVAYLDTSAAVKLLLKEPETAALRRWLRSRPRRASAALLRVELPRVVKRAGLPVLLNDCRRLLSGIQLIRLDDMVLNVAGDLEPPSLRPLDAIHLAAARSLAGDLDSVVTYDLRMIEAGQALGLSTISPG